jgi:hypothetical protein
VAVTGAGSMSRKQVAGPESTPEQGSCPRPDQPPRQLRDIILPLATGNDDISQSAILHLLHAALRILQISASFLHFLPSLSAFPARCLWHPLDSNPTSI